MHPIIQKTRIFKKILKELRSSNTLDVMGLWDSSKAALVAFLSESEKITTLVLTSGLSEAERFYRDLSFFSDFPCSFFPSWEILHHEKIPPHIDIVAERFSCLESLRENDVPRLVVAPVQAVIHRVIDPSHLKDLVLELKKGTVFMLRQLIESLDKLGFRRESVAESKGEYAVRGGIVDLFSPQEENPVRLEFEGNQIISLRRFDAQTQVSLEEIDQTKVLPSCELELMEKIPSWVNFDAYLPKKFLLVFSHWDEIFEKVQSMESEIPAEIKDYIKLEDLKAHRTLNLSEMGKSINQRKSPMHVSVQRTSSWKTVETLEGPLGYRSEIFSKIAEKTKEDFLFYFISRKEAEGHRLAEIMKEKGIWDAARHQVLAGDLSNGFILPEEKQVILTDEEIFGRFQARPLRRRVKRGIPIREYTELSVGDGVVHLNYGIGKYLGISQLNDRGIRGEFLSLEYDKGAKLYVPVDQIELVERYIGIKGKAPKLSRLGGKDWDRTKKKAQNALRDFAAELLNFQAQRAALKGYAFSPDTPWQRDFEASFIYTETPDQLNAIEAVKKDLESEKPMDRLICGDVGYGKTEVAIRAAFKVVMGGKQVAILVPTTILAQQHFYTLHERFSGYPIEVEMLSRFRTVSEQNRILQLLREGRVDVVVGTHRLLGQDVIFKDLGLVIVDEEQRFGVAHKEKFKKIRTLVDVLTLTATPIPRTLYLSMMQARDMSLINTPPEDRLPVETIITPYDERLIRDAIVREISRDGQVFYVHNRVQSIHRVKERLQKIVPEAGFAVAHGQMHEDELEEIMRNFIEGKIQVLVSTNIVESGLDIPNANTIIIDRADRFGLADLYQLRGRVGRFKRRAYAYLVYSQDMILNRDARIRLKTIEDFTDLGSGFKVAMRDLEIRGAGNVLGKEQHGHITAIGFSLYCRLLDETVRRLKGQKVQEKHPVSIQLGFDLMIPPAYIGEPSLRIEMYHKIFDADSEEDLGRVTHEFLDRFGTLPEEVILLMEVALLKAFARRQGITSIQLHRDRIYFRQGDAIRRVEQVPKMTFPKSLVLQLRNLLKQETSYDNVKKIRSARTQPLGVLKSRSSRFKEV